MRLIGKIFIVFVFFTIIAIPSSIAYLIWVLLSPQDFLQRILGLGITLCIGLVFFFLTMLMWVIVAKIVSD